MSFIEADDETDLFFKDWGNGKPVVLIHGWPLNADMWEYQMGWLAAQGLRCVAYDRRGFGRSSQPWGGYDYDTFADDLETVLDELDLEAVTLVGFSMGGGEVARYLRRHGSERIEKVVLLGAVTPFLLKTDDNPDGADRSVFDGFIAGLEANRPRFLAEFGPQFFGSDQPGSPVTKEILDWAQAMALPASPRATTECVRAFGMTDFREDMAAFDVPTLVIHGTADTTVPIEISGRKAARLIDGAELIEYEGAPHGLFFTHKDRLNQDLLAFVNR
jgi:non-heme chloroperoxidase